MLWSPYNLMLLLRMYHQLLDQLPQHHQEGGSLYLAARAHADHRECGLVILQAHHEGAREVPLWLRRSQGFRRRCHQRGLGQD